MSAQSLPPDIAQFVEEQVAAGHYRSEQDVLVNAVRVLRSVQDRQIQFNEDVRLGMEQLERGEFNEYDAEGMQKRFEELKRQAALRADKNGGAGR
ncbi:MAG: hypothetical protein GX594_03595 [Pirellulaceae bacterium]|nr:hypothetical protein [Pirellulaceae bacterium]